MRMRSSVGLSPGDHIVHFYRDDVDLAGVVVESLAPALSCGEPVVVIAVAAHREAFAAGFLALGIDLDSAEAVGTVTWRDAEEIAAQLLVGQRVDVDTFEASVAPLVREAAAGQRIVHIYGEIVSVLWAAGEVVAAMDLEALWNGLIADTPISLLCGYPADLVAVDNGLAGYVHVCDHHGRTVGSAPTAPGAEVSCRFPGTAAYARHARRFVSDALHEWGRTELLDVAALVVSELAGNAIRHTRSEFTVALVRDGAVIRILVGDNDSNPPQPRVSALDEPNGRGLLLVRAVSSRWGHEVLPGGKLVWAELPVASARPAC
jgi:anti-sigma regulatory factor (Ser/Thr protein kinase)